MTVVESNVFINATPDQVDGIASNPRRWPEWYADVEKIRIDPVFPEVGGKVEITFNIAGITFKVRFTQREFVPAHKSVCSLDGRFEGTSQFIVSEENNGSRASLALKYRTPGGFLGGVANNVFVRDRIQQNLDASLNNLKGLVESEI